MFETFFANLGINLLQNKDPLTAIRDAGISSASGNLFDKAFESFKLGGEIANQGVQNAEFVSPMLTDSAGTATTAMNPTGYMGNTSMMQNPMVRNIPSTPMPTTFNARSAYPFSEQGANVAQYGALTDNVVAQGPDFTPRMGTSVDYTGGGMPVAESPSLLGQAVEKGKEMVSNISGGDVATGGLLYMNKLDQDRKFKDMLMAQRAGSMGGISRNQQAPTAGQILKVKVT